MRLLASSNGFIAFKVGGVKVAHFIKKFNKCKKRRIIKMAFSVDTFRSEMSGGGARPSLFDILLTAPAWVGFPSSQFPFKAKASSIPASTIGEKTVSYFGHDVKFAGDRTFADWTITVYNDEDFAIRDAFERWLDGMDRHSQEGSVRGEASSNPASYVGSALVQQYGKGGSVLKSYEFINLWPKEIGEITLDWDTKDDIETFDVTLSYDYYRARTTT